MTMQRRPTLLLLLALAGASAAAPLASEMLLKPADHEKLGEVVGDYWKALKESEGTNEAFEAVNDAYEKVQKRVAKDLPDGNLLAAVEDWEQILYFAYTATEVDEKGAKKGKTERVYKDKDFGDYAIAVSTPAKYSAKTGPYPLLICVPPKGKSGKEHLATDWVDPALLEGAILASPDMPTNELNWGEVGDTAGHGGIDTVLLCLRSIKQTHAVDVNRVFLAGFEEGVAPAARIAAIYPHVFAGVIGRTGDVGDLSPVNFRNLPTFFAGSGEKTTTFQTRAKEEGIENVTLNAAGTEADIWAWMQKTVRVANPTDVSLVPQHTSNERAYWLWVRGVSPNGSKIRARIDRAANTIKIESEGITTATVFFNDTLVDLSKPVKVDCNGTVSEDFIPRTLKVMLDNGLKSGDTGRVYVSSHSYDIPVVTK